RRPQQPLHRAGLGGDPRPPLLAVLAPVVMELLDTADRQRLVLHPPQRTVIEMHHFSTSLRNAASARRSIVPTLVVRVPMAAAIEVQEYLLGHVLGAGPVLQDPVGDRQHLAVLVAKQPLEGIGHASANARRALPGYALVEGGGVQHPPCQHRPGPECDARSSG